MSGLPQNYAFLLSWQVKTRRPWLTVKVFFYENEQINLCCSNIKIEKCTSLIVSVSMFLHWKLKMKNAMHYKTDKCNHDNWRKSDDVDVNRHEWSFAKAAAPKWLNAKISFSESPERIRAWYQNRSLSKALQKFPFCNQGWKWNWIKILNILTQSDKASYSDRANKN